MAAITLLDAPAARSRARSVWKWRAAALVVGTLLAIPGSIVWPQIREAIFFSQDRTADEIAQFVMEQNGIPGAVVAFGSAGSQPTIHAYGLASVASNERMTADRRFRLASLSKPITDESILLLAESGTIDLSAPLAAYFPEVARADDERYGQITIRQIMSHTSGIPREPGDLNKRPNYSVGDSEDCGRFARAMLLQPLEHAPGEKETYSNLGYCWLGMLVSKASGTSYEAFVRGEILSTAGANGMGIGSANNMTEHFPAPVERLREVFASAEGWVGSAAEVFRVASYVRSDFKYQGLTQGAFGVVAKGNGVIAVLLFNGQPARPKETGPSIRRNLLDQFQKRPHQAQASLRGVTAR